jgi:hypothetical protein
MWLYPETHSEIESEWGKADMERPKRPYSIHSRPTKKKNRRIYYAVFRNETGAYGTAMSTGSTRRDDAVRWCEARLKEVRDRSEKVTLAEYAEGFWRTDAPFAQDRAAHGRAVSNGYLDISEGYARKHLLPKWGSRQLRELTTKAIDDWVVELHRRAELAPATINKILQCLRTIFDRAVIEGFIAENPAAPVRPVRAVRPERKVLTLGRPQGSSPPRNSGTTTVSTPSTYWPPLQQCGWARSGPFGWRT